MKRGFSLLETVLVMGISIGALIALVNLFLLFNSTYGYQQAFMSTAGSAGTAMSALEAAVLPADKILASHSFSGTTYSSATTTLVLELPKINGAGYVISGEYDYIAFYASSTTLYQLTQAGGGSTRASGIKQLSTTLNSISFTYGKAVFSNVTNVIADVQTQAQFKQQTVQGHLHEKLFLRNL